MEWRDGKLFLGGIGSDSVTGEISISYGKLYTVFCFMTRIFRLRKKTK